MAERDIGMDLREGSCCSPHQEPAPYTVVQTYADRLRFNQSKRGWVLP